jgi:hypothetical protein
VYCFGLRIPRDARVAGGEGGTGWGTEGADVVDPEASSAELDEGGRGTDDPVGDGVWAAGDRVCAGEGAEDPEEAGDRPGACAAAGAPGERARRA